MNLQVASVSELRTTADFVGVVRLGGSSHIVRAVAHAISCMFAACLGCRLPFAFGNTPAGGDRSRGGGSLYRSRVSLASIVTR